MAPAARRGLRAGSSPRARPARSTPRRRPGPRRPRRAGRCAVTLVLRAPPYLPLRPSPTSSSTPERGPRADPLLGLLGALGALPPGWRVLSQLVVAPGAGRLGAALARLALERPLAAVDPRSASRGAGPGTSSSPLAWPGSRSSWRPRAPTSWYQAGDWLRLGLGAGFVGVGLPGRRLRPGRRSCGARSTTRALVREKLARPRLRRAELRLAVFAPARRRRRRRWRRGWPSSRRPTASSPARPATASGRARRDLPGRDVRGPATALAPGIAAAGPLVLNTREVAGLWHLPQAGADAAARRADRRPPAAPPRGAGRRGLPDRPRPAQQGHPRPRGAAGRPARPPTCCWSPRPARGKSSLLLRLASRATGSAHRAGAAVLVSTRTATSPRDASAWCRRGREDDVVFLDVADADAPVRAQPARRGPRLGPRPGGRRTPSTSSGASSTASGGRGWPTASATRP